ncbi:PepSY domain-containing protein [Actinopolyspora saharensis]|uniref:Peptidase propeptide and YPEB domain-containing protein n=1 Tax=Actinopolyspora saharensis TaxID=995062 RepID=A0A1H1EM95_9ACTN|nr:PepSY domain-containing protein [Actinopolyspora saharensis]SDQ89629.1 Peptidase propeptide and YPEB domain-containing protein [Actinopolyspora saharensis]
MPGNKKLVGALAVAGGVLALGGTAVAFGSGGGSAAEAAGDAPAEVRSVSEGNDAGPDGVYTGPDPDEVYTGPDPDEVYTGPDPDEVYTGPGEGYRGPRPEHCTKEKPAVNGDRAREIALERVPQAKVIEVELDRCYGLEWELELREGQTEYDVTVDARSGDVVGYEQDRDD